MARMAWTEGTNHKDEIGIPRYLRMYVLVAYEYEPRRDAIKRSYDMVRTYTHTHIHMYLRIQPCNERT
jgi:hypothetical protein